MFYKVFEKVNDTLVQVASFATNSEAYIWIQKQDNPSQYRILW